MPAGETNRGYAVSGGDGLEGSNGSILSVLASVSASIGGLREEMAKSREARPRIPWQDCHPVGPIGSVTLSAGAGTYDVPDLLGPHDPYWWDLRLLSAWGFTAGTVNVFKNGTFNQIGSLAAPGNITWSAQQLLAPRDRVVIVASGITGSVNFELRAIEIASPWLPDYLV